MTLKQTSTERIEPIEVETTAPVIRVTKAPKRSEITLELLNESQGIDVWHDMLYIGSPDSVAYRVVGLGERRDTLILEKAE